MVEDPHRLKAGFCVLTIKLTTGIGLKDCAPACSARILVSSDADGSSRTLRASGTGRTGSRKVDVMWLL